MYTTSRWSVHFLRSDSKLATAIIHHGHTLHISSKNTQALWLTNHSKKSFELDSKVTLQLTKYPVDLHQHDHGLLTHNRGVERRERNGERKEARALLRTRQHILRISLDVLHWAHHRPDSQPCTVVSHSTTFGSKTTTTRRSEVARDESTETLSEVMECRQLKSTACCLPN